MTWTIDATRPQPPTGVPSAADNRDLARRARAGGPGARAARDELVTRNIPLARKYAARHLKPGLDADDMGQLGAIGLIRAAERYDPEAGPAFSTYARHWVECEARLGSVPASRIIIVPSHTVAAATAAGKARGRLGRTLGREPSREEVAKEAKIRPSMVALAEAHWPVVFRESDGPEDISMGVAQPALCRSPGPEEEAEAADDLDCMRSAMARLAERDRRLITLRFGLGGGPEATYTEIGRELGVCKATAARDVAHALRALRAEMGWAEGGTP
jgi:RNA polymerase primary sigma factor